MAHRKVALNPEEWAVHKLGSGRRRIKVKPDLPSGEYDLSPAGTYLKDRGWIVFKFEGELRWLDPIKPHDVSYSEGQAIDLQLRRDEIKDAGRYHYSKKEE